MKSVKFYILIKKTSWKNTNVFVRVSISAVSIFPLIILLLHIAYRCFFVFFASFFSCLQASLIRYIADNDGLFLFSPGQLQKKVHTITIINLIIIIIFILFRSSISFSICSWQAYHH
jgi:hypothetical protein